jgi:hypothetical protein
MFLFLNIIFNLIFHIPLQYVFIVLYENNSSNKKENNEKDDLILIEEVLKPNLQEFVFHFDVLMIVATIVKWTTEMRGVRLPSGVFDFGCVKHTYVNQPNSYA